MSQAKDISKNNICGLCDINTSKYCCPRCEVFYCSLECYKSEKHLECSESFYRDCVNQELSSNQVDDVAKQKMIEILKKMQNSKIDSLEDIEDFNTDTGINGEDEDSDDDLEIDLHTRIKDLNLNDPDAIWNVLTNDERNDFDALINSGDVGGILPPWEPWWKYYKNKELVKEIEKNVDVDYCKNCPALKNVPQFETLTSVKPSPAISFNISNILASYAFIMRYFNGEVDPKETVVFLLEICSNLNSSTNFEDLDIAIESVVQNCLQSELIETDKNSLDVMRHDTLMLLRGPSDNNKLYYSKAALSDLLEMFTEYKSSLKTSNSTKSHGEFTRKYPDHANCLRRNLDKNKISKIIKKLQYYLAFLCSCDVEIK